MVRPVGKLFRPVVIEPELRELVDEILAAHRPDDREAVNAKRRIQKKATPANCYLYAVEIRNYLEEKTRIGTEPRLFTLAGDLFLNALEATAGAVGPNFFKDHYSGVLGCYKEGDDHCKAVEGPIYCLDLLLLKTLDLTMEPEEPQAAIHGPLPAFVPAEAPDRRSRVRECLQFGDEIIRDAVQQALNARQGEVPAGLIDFVAGHRVRMGRVLAQWTRFLQEERPVYPPEKYLEAALDAARKAEYPPLVAAMRERLARLGDVVMELPAASARLYFEAADGLLSHGNFERDSDAFNLALRRYARSAELFDRIRDRTSAAKALVEQARVYIRRGHDGAPLRDCLHKAVSLVVAHRDNLPQGRLPALDGAAVHAFLESKGYHAEATAYEAALEKQRK